ncbi:hypothetical protein QUF63_15865 [Anaerolineales bacterium HSG25]|nr:hypothetical protein [Anaerolineales bacterium HSG25]
MLLHVYFRQKQEAFALRYCQTGLISPTVGMSSSVIVTGASASPIAKAGSFFAWTIHLRGM